MKCAGRPAESPGARRSLVLPMVQSAAASKGPQVPPLTGRSLNIECFRLTFTSPPCVRETCMFTPPPVSASQLDPRAPGQPSTGEPNTPLLSSHHQRLPGSSTHPRLNSLVLRFSFQPPPPDTHGRQDSDGHLSHGRHSAGYLIQHIAPLNPCHHFSPRTDEGLGDFGGAVGAELGKPWGLGGPDREALLVRASGASVCCPQQVLGRLGCS